MDLTGTRVGVTGAGGFIGNALCRRLVAEGAVVAGLERDRAAGARVEAAGAELRVCDIGDAGAALGALADCPLVVNTAAIVGDWGSMDEYVAVNVRGARNVLDAARAAGAERVVHVSSVAIWGYEFGHDLDEDASPRPCGAPYIDTKGAADQLALARGATVVRPGDVYGPGSVPWALRPLAALRARRLYVPRGGGGLLTLVYVDDLVDCLVRALVAAGAHGRAFTAWDGRPVSAGEFFGHYARMLGRRRVGELPLPALWLGALGQELGARARGGAPAFSRQALLYVSRRALYPNTRARTELGWEPHVALEEGMRRTEDWFREVGLL